MDTCLDGLSKTGTRKENRVQRVVQISIRVAGGRGGPDTEGKRIGSIKQSNCGTGIDKT